MQPSSTVKTAYSAQGDIRTAPFGGQLLNGRPTLPGLTISVEPWRRASCTCVWTAGLVPLHLRKLLIGRRRVDVQHRPWGTVDAQHFRPAEIELKLRLELSEKGL